MDVLLHVYMYICYVPYLLHVAYACFLFCMYSCFALLYVVAMLVCLIYMYLYTFYACSH